MSQIVMEHCVGGSISDLITICEIQLEEHFLKYALAATALGLRYLHSQKLIHRVSTCPFMYVRGGSRLDLPLSSTGLKGGKRLTHSRWRSQVG